MVAAAALRMPAAVLQRILLCLNPAISQSVQRVYDLTLLHEELKAASALRLVAIWQAADREGNSPRCRARRGAAAAARGGGQPPAAPAARPKILWEALARKADSA